MGDLIELWDHQQMGSWKKYLIRLPVKKSFNLWAFSYANQYIIHLYAMKENHSPLLEKVGPYYHSLFRSLFSHRGKDGKFTSQQRHNCSMCIRDNGTRN